jgi:hypothetical protein
MARAARGATVPAFSRPTFSVVYPFTIRGSDSMPSSL